MDCVWQRDVNLGASLLVVLETDCQEDFLPEAQEHEGPEHQRAHHSAHKNCVQSTLLPFC